MAELELFPLELEFCELELLFDADGFDLEGIIGIPRLPSYPNKGVLLILEDILA